MEIYENQWKSMKLIALKLEQAGPTASSGRVSGA